MATNSSRMGGDAWRFASPLTWPSPAPGFLVAAAVFARTAARAVRQEALKDGVFLVPVRVFIGIGWLRASAEKLVEPGWRDGTRLVDFLDRQLPTDVVVFSPYQALLNDAFIPHALVLGWTVMLGQLLAGLAIASGFLTRAALLGGIFMNLNFVLTGAPDPSAFYVVIQAALLLSGAGTVLGVDAWIAKRGRFPALAASPPRLRSCLAIATPAAMALATLTLGVAVYATAHIRDWTPAGSVHDPAAVLAVLAFMAAAWFTILALRGDRLSSSA